MQQLKTNFLIIILFVILCFGCPPSAIAANQSNSLIGTLYQIKNVLIKHYSSYDIEKMIKQANEAGAQGLKLAYPSPPASFIMKDMGWLIEDSKGMEVFRVYFSFMNNVAKDGRYLGPLMSNKARRGTDQEIFLFHRELLSKNLKRVSTDKYDLGDGCIASLTLFKNSADPGRTAVNVECH